MFWVLMATLAFASSACSARWNRPKNGTVAPPVSVGQNPPSPSFWVSESGADVPRTGGNFRVGRVTVSGAPKQKASSSAHFIVSAF